MPSLAQMIAARCRGTCPSGSRRCGGATRPGSTPRRARSPRPPRPHCLKRRSRPPPAVQLSIRAKARATASSSATSAAIAGCCSLPNSSVISATACASTSRQATRPPAPMRYSAQPRPMPCAPPVITAALFIAFASRRALQLTISPPSGPFDPADLSGTLCQAPPATSRSSAPRTSAPKASSTIRERIRHLADAVRPASASAPLGTRRADELTRWRSRR